VKNSEAVLRIRTQVRAPRTRRMTCQECQRSVLPVISVVRDYEDYQGSPWFVGYEEVAVCPVHGCRVVAPNRPTQEPAIIDLF
jgi:hypothetical protein